MVRAKCYLVLQGLERSLADNLVHNYNVDDAAFLITEEQDRALNRLREDMDESGTRGRQNWGPVGVSGLRWTPKAGQVVKLQSGS